MTVPEKVWKVCELPPAYNFVDEEDNEEWNEWAIVQHLGGLVQSQCSECGLWRFPQEVCDHVKGAVESE